jgi:pyruvate kinase
MQLLKKTKIIATISNKACSVPLLKEMYKAGMNVVRLNTAHQSLEDAVPVIENIRAVSERIGIMIDTKGPEIRTLGGTHPLEVKTGDLLRIKGDCGEPQSEGSACMSATTVSPTICR